MSRSREDSRTHCHTPALFKNFRGESKNVCVFNIPYHISAVCSEEPAWYGHAFLRILPDPVLTHPSHVTASGFYPKKYYSLSIVLFQIMFSFRFCSLPKSHKRKLIFCGNYTTRFIRVQHAISKQQTHPNDGIRVLSKKVLLIANCSLLDIVHSQKLIKESLFSPYGGWRYYSQLGLLGELRLKKAFRSILAIFFGAKDFQKFGISLTFYIQFF